MASILFPASSRKKLNGVENCFQQQRRWPITGLDL
jgi:hypothetical protein